MSITVESKPCWMAVCDHCEEGDNEFGDSFHYESEARAREAIKNADWVLGPNGKCYCLSCVEGHVEEVECPHCAAEVGDGCSGEPVAHEERVLAWATKLDRASGGEQDS